MKVRGKKGAEVLMIKQFKAHLKVSESGRLAGEVSACNHRNGRDTVCRLHTKMSRNKS